jgi:hypothetical protein
MVSKIGRVYVPPTVATGMSEDIDGELILALTTASEQIDGLNDMELFKLMETAESIRRQLKGADIDANKLAFIMFQLSIEAKKMEKPHFDMAFV